MAQPDLLRVEGLSVWYPGAGRPALADLDLAVAPGECVAVVGPSGSGKSTLCRALLDLLPPGSRCTGRIAWCGEDLVAGSARWRGLRGGALGLVLQDHRHALDPVRRVGDQLDEVVALRAPHLDRAARRRRVAELLAAVHLDQVPDVARRHAHELSGGQRQRVNLAATLAGGPRLLLADEPTTALDLPVQREILALLLSLVRDAGLSLLLVTHDRDLVPLVADRVLEVGAATPAVATGTAPATGSTVPTTARLAARRVHVSVASRGGPRDVVCGVDLELAPGRTVGLAGESGSGKTTLLRALAGWLRPRAGSVELAGPVPAAPAARRRLVQLVSQDPAAALDPQQTVHAAIREAASQVAGRRDAAERARRLLADVDLTADLGRRLPRELSGGQRQRAQLARALAVAPWFLLADEPTSSLDPDRRLALLALLARLREVHGIGLVIASHDLGLLAARADEVVVMHAGLIVERYRPARHAEPRHPFAAALAAASPTRLTPADLRLPSVARGDTRPAAPGRRLVGPGCPYAPRCPHAEPACRTALPPLVEETDGRWLRCPVRGLGAR
ncbi:MAG: ATP-binding cassette domain-containing protein [Candidatus Krumholzibacteriia bacterium]